MPEYRAVAWQADWLVGWLASVGVVYRDRAIKLSWSDDVIPRAVFHVDDLERLDAALPSPIELDELAVARELPGYSEFGRNPSRKSYGQRSGVARRNGDLSVGVTLSDVGAVPKDPLFHSPLDPPAPRGITIGQRLVATRSACAVDETLRMSMMGQASRQKGNGLGFDLRRLSASSVPGELVCEPFAETMAFFGLMLFTQVGESTRGWADGSSRKTGAFSWPTWHGDLGWAGIDAALDQYYASATKSFEPSAIFDSVAYRPTSSSEASRGISGVLRT